MASLSNKYMRIYGFDLNSSLADLGRHRYQNYVIIAVGCDLWLKMYNDIHFDDYG